MYSNTDLDNIITPVNAQNFEQLLNECNYDPKKTQYLVNGFINGFDIGYKGSTKVRRFAPNLKLRVGSTLELWNKVMTEVNLGRYAGPFNEPPFKFFIQSPIGLVPKDKCTKTRLIFHLSYPKKGNSVNSAIPKYMTSVKYPEFEEAVKLCLLAG